MRFRDLKPYEAPRSLADLRGPYNHAIITLGRSVWWVGDGRIDLDSDAMTQTAYQALLSEGTRDDQAANVNARRLGELWPTLRVDSRVRELWESRFAELGGACATPARSAGHVLYRDVKPYAVPSLLDELHGP